MTLGRWAAFSHPGRRRRRNEDAWVADPPLFAIADGMGGAQGGEVASRLAAGAVEHNGQGSGEDRVVALIQEANKRVHDRAAEDSSVSGMGTTMTLALVEDSLVTIGHVGDSRAYLIRDGALEQVTDDHTLVAELVRSGKLSPEEADSHPQRSVITRALGTDPDVDVDTFSIEPRPGDLFMLCSDGLSSMVGDDTILAVVAQHRGDLEAAAKKLVDAANRSGGEDNITVVFFEIVDGSAPSVELEETATYPSLDEPEADDDEDTLSGLERVPAVDTAVVPPEEAEAHAPAAEPARGLRRILAVLLVVLILLASAAALYWFLYL